MTEYETLIDRAKKLDEKIKLALDMEDEEGPILLESYREELNTILSTNINEGQTKNPEIEFLLLKTKLHSKRDIKRARKRIKAKFNHD